jgi:hypothetical protein
MFVKAFLSSYILSLFFYLCFAFFLADLFLLICISTPSLICGLWSCGYGETR